MDSYEERLLKHASLLQQSSVSVDNESKRTQKHVQEVNDSLQKELRFCGEQLVLLHEETARTAKRVKQMVNLFQHVVKKGDLNKIKSQVNAWGPEKKISRKMFLRMKELS